MFRDRLVTLTAAAVVFTACSGKLLTITISESSETVVEAGTPLEVIVDDVGFGGFLDLDIAADQALANQGVEPGDISEVYFTELVLTATDPNGADLAFLETLEFYISADGLDRVLVASQDDFPTGQARVELVLEDVDITDYVVADRMDLTTEVNGSRPSSDTTVLAEFTLKVGATRQGVCNQITGK